MKDISPELQRTLKLRAKEHYSSELPYHDWNHAMDVVRSGLFLATYSIDPEIRSTAGLMVVTAAWHDADYHLPVIDDSVTKEERSAGLIATELPELSDEQQQFVYDGIIDTTVAKTYKTNLFGEAIHAADLGYFAHPRPRFLSRLRLMRAEWGSPGWKETIDTTVTFGKTVIDRAEEVMPLLLKEEDSARWIGSIVKNLAYLQDPGNTSRFR